MNLIEKTLNELSKLEERVQVRQTPKGKVKIKYNGSDENNLTYESSNVSYMNFPSSHSQHNLTKVEVVVNDDEDSEAIEEKVNREWDEVFGKTINLLK